MPAIIPSFVDDGKVDIGLKPHCTKAHPDRKPPSPTFVWTLELRYDVPPEHVSTVVLPPMFRQFRDRMLKAHDKEGRKFVVSDEPRADVEMDLVMAHGGVQIRDLNRIPVRVMKLTLTAAPGVCRLVVLLKAAVPAVKAPQVLDLIRSDVMADIRATGALPFPDKGVPDEEAEEDGGNDEEETEAAELPPEPEPQPTADQAAAQAPEVGGTQARRRVRNLSVVSDGQ